MNLTEETNNAFKTIQEMVSGFFALLPQIGIAIVVFIILWIIAGIISRLVTRVLTDRASKGVGTAIGRVVNIALLFVAFLFSVAIITPSVGAAELLQVLGVGSVAIGFAFRDILQNFLAGLLILLRQPFKVGDWIVFDSFEGTVSEISTRSTWLRTFDGHDITIPNGQLFTNPVSVVSKDPLARSQYDVGISYDADIEKAKSIALKILEQNALIDKTKGPDVGVKDLGDSAVVLRMRWWSKTSDMYGLKQEVLQSVKEAYDKQEIAIPYPHTQLVLPEAINMGQKKGKAATAV